MLIRMQRVAYSNRLQASGCIVMEFSHVDRVGGCRLDDSGDQ
jgi:hypothetical protein